MPNNEQKRDTNDDNGNGCEGDRENDPIPSTTKDPTRISHNMNDLTAFDFNSADDIRQAMKTARYELFSQNHINQSQSQTHNDTQQGIASPVNTDKNKSDQQNFQNSKSDEKSRLHNERPSAGCSKSNKTRSGRPPKCGTSRMIQKSKTKSRYDDIYKGKLSNIVPFKNRRRNYQDSDAESLIFFN